MYIHTHIPALAKDAAKADAPDPVVGARLKFAIHAYIHMSHTYT